MNELIIYTDGGCSPNPGKGAWSIVISEMEYYRGQKKMTTNNEMELTAIRNAILYRNKYHPQKKLVVVSDSKYCVDGFNSWMVSWQKKGWTKKNGQIANLGLWKELFDLDNNVELRWTKGHNGQKFNELADELAKWMD